MSEELDLRDHIDTKFDAFIEKQERRDREDRHERIERDKRIFEKIDTLVAHDHDQDMKIAENRSAIEAVDKKVDDDIEDLETTKGFWLRKFRFRWSTLFKVLGWVFGPTGLLALLWMIWRMRGGG